MQSVKQLTWCLARALRPAQGIVQYQLLASRSQNPCCWKCQLSRSLTSKQNERHHVAIVGSGPAGYYTAQQLLKGDPSVVVDIYEKLPVPFGLVRFGVAPDHPEVKNVIHTFTKTSQNERCNFFGNVEVGKDVSLQDLRNAYSAVVLCYGASDDKTLGIPGENSSNVISARSFVGWYNGLPEDSQLAVNLDCESAVVLGHGNVALDVARILLTPINILEKTDITENSLEALRKSRIKRVHVVGRRGPLQVAFTIKELREMINLPQTRTVIQSSDVAGLDAVIPNLPRSRKRLIELIYKTATSEGDAAAQQLADSHREWRLVFQRSPVSVLQNDARQVKGIEFAVNKLEGETPETQKAVATDIRETIECGLVLRSIGYKSLTLDDSLPFDTSKGVIDNENSRVKGGKGLYCAGWVGRGPVGVILGTMTDAFETGKLIVQDLHDGVLESKGGTARDELVEKLKSLAVTFPEWEKIDTEETREGEKIGKPREKLTDVEKMLNIAKS